MPPRLAAAEGARLERDTPRAAPSLLAHPHGASPLAFSSPADTTTFPRALTLCLLRHDPLCPQGYVPPNSERQSTLQRKRREYRDLVWQHFERGGVAEDRSEEELAVLRQIAVDVPRTAPGVALMREPCVQQALERVLFIRATRAAASSYVQARGTSSLLFAFLLLSLKGL